MAIVHETTMRPAKLELLTQWLLTAPGTWVGHPTRPRCAEMAKPPGRSDDPVVFTAALTVRRQTVWFLARLLQQHRAEIGTRRDTRALGAAKVAGNTHVNLDGTLIHTDRVATPGPNGADLWWSGKRKEHGGNIQVLSDAAGFPI